MTNFDQAIDRRHTNSFKWDRYSDTNVIPVWVADMDFQAAPPILSALDKITQHGVFGYSRCPDELYQVVIDRLQNRHNWTIKKEWLVFLPGLVPAIGLACRFVGQANDGVIMTTPVYHPFMHETTAAKRQLQKVPMVLVDNRWTVDFKVFEQTITPQTKIFLLCNPHNPGGTVFTKDELQQFADICLKHNVLICSDEIHCDLILDDSKPHISIATLGPEVEQNSITLLSPSKTFNIAGLGCSFAVIPNDELRAKFIQEKAGLMPMIPPYSFEAALAAYRDGDQWHRDLLDYLKSNHDYLLTEINNLKGLSMQPLEGTYLAWIDARKAGFDDYVARLEAAGVGVSPGKMFDGDGFFRLNFACTKATLIVVVERIKTVFGSKNNYI